MALQMRNAKASNVADLAGLDGIELVFAAQDLRHRIETGLVLGVNGHALIPGAAIEIEILLHVSPHKQRAGRTGPVHHEFELASALLNSGGRLLGGGAHP
jgi:hypothetical protein